MLMIRAKWHQNSGFFAKMGKSYKKAVWDEESLLGKYIEGEVFFQLQIFLLANPKVLFVSQKKFL